MELINKLTGAAFTGDLETLQELMNLVEVDEEGRHWNCLHAAIESAQLKCYKFIVSKGADLNYKIGSFTPLEHAIDVYEQGLINDSHENEDCLEIIQDLVARGVPKIHSLDYAKRADLTKIIKILDS